MDLGDRTPFVGLFLALSVGCEGGSEFPDNFGGVVTLDGEPAPNVGLVIVSENGNRLPRRTDEDGIYSAFLALDPSSDADETGYEVSITGEGLPNDSLCQPLGPQSVVVGGARLPMPPAIDFGCVSLSAEDTSPYADCTEQPPGSVECSCDPFNDNCSGNTNCSTNFFFDPATGEITAVPALDGSDGTPASECVADFIQVVGEGDPCNVSATATQRFDDCLPGLFCDEVSGFVCVPLCVAGRACADGNCEFFTLTNPEIGLLGRCTEP